MNIRQIKALDAKIGLVGVKLLPRVRRNFLSEIHSILLIRPGGIGDAVLLAQAIHLIKSNSPQTCITLLAERRNASVFSLIPGADKVLCYDRLHVFCKAILGRYDAVIDTEQWYRLSAVVARLVRAPVKIGFGTNDRLRMFTHAIPYDMDAYEADNFLALLKPLGMECERDSNSIALKLPLESMANADQLLQPLCSEPFVVISPGSSVPEKCWGEERFRLVAKQLAADGYKVVVVGGREDCAAGDMIVESGGMNLAGMTTLAETAAVIARASLVISGDSGVLHIAAGLNVPTLSLFGPSSVKKWAPRGDNHIVLSHHLPCSPCSKFGTIPPCPIDARCMKEITPDEVMDAARRLLSQPPE